MKSYDLIPENEGLLLDFPFREGLGIVTTDHAQPHHKGDLKNTPSWETLQSRLNVLTFDKTLSQYAEIDSTVSADLGFTTGDYSIGCWFKRNYTAVTDMIIAKYLLNVGGWEVYLTDMSPAVNDDYLTLRHHHANGLATRTACYSLEWAPDIWWFMGISRSGAYPQHYRNGEPVEMGYAVGGLESPESSAAYDVVIGTRSTKDFNFFDGSLQGIRIWNRALSHKEWQTIFNRERDYFGV